MWTGTAWVDASSPDAAKARGDAATAAAHPTPPPAFGSVVGGAPGGTGGPAGPSSQPGGYRGQNYGAANANATDRPGDQPYGGYSENQLGDYWGGANDIAGNLSRAGGSFQGRTGVQINNPYAADNRGMQLGARGQQGDALGLMRSAAMGNAPSAAQVQMGQGLDQAMQQQMAAANSARGGGGNVALAQRNAAAGGQQMQIQGVNQASQLRAQEMAQARGAYSEAATSQRAQDLQAAGLDAQTAFQQAGLEAAQRAQNDAMQGQYEGMGLNAEQAQLNANLQRYGADRGVQVAQSAANAATTNGALSAGAAALGGLMALA